MDIREKLMNNLILAKKVLERDVKAITQRYQSINSYFQKLERQKQVAVLQNRKSKSKFIYATIFYSR